MRLHFVDAEIMVLGNGARQYRVRPLLTVLDLVKPLLRIEDSRADDGQDSSGYPDEAARAARGNAKVVLFLSSDEASFVTAAFFVADGGFSTHYGMSSLSGVGRG